MTKIALKNVFAGSAKALIIAPTRFIFTPMTGTAHDVHIWTDSWDNFKNGFLDGVQQAKSGLQALVAQ